MKSTGPESGTGPAARCSRFEQESGGFSPCAYEIQLSEQLLWFQVYPAFPLQRTYLAEQSRHDSDVNGRVQNVRGSALSAIDTF
jgi:hypothetical protein